VGDIAIRFALPSDSLELSRCEKSCGRNRPPKSMRKNWSWFSHSGGLGTAAGVPRDSVGCRDQ